MSAKGSGSSPQPRKSKGSYLYEEIYIADDPEPRDILHSVGHLRSGTAPCRYRLVSRSARGIAVTILAAVQQRIYMPPT
jgi:hypothetical protein